MGKPKINIKSVDETERKILYDAIFDVEHDGMKFEGSVTAEVSENEFGMSEERDMDIYFEDEVTEGFFNGQSDEIYEAFKNGLAKVIAQKEIESEK